MRGQKSKSQSCTKKLLRKKSKSEGDKVIFVGTFKEDKLDLKRENE